jgi:hypothetical protein
VVAGRATADGRVPTAPEEGAPETLLQCPLCDYDLRGLPDPRCPECGYTFEWADLTDPAKRRHPYLFEHHPERNAWSFWRTATAGLRPAKFWSRLYPTQPSRPRRLGLYAGLVVAPAVLVPAVFYVRTLVWWMGLAASWVGNSRRPPTVLHGMDLLRAAWFTNPRPSEVLTALGHYLLWALLTYLSLLVFRISMRRARVRPAHVARCVVYSFDALFWVAAPAAVAGVGSIVGGLMGLSGLPPTAVMIATIGAPPLLAVTVVYRLWVAYRGYLRFEHAFLTVLASQLIALLVWINLVLFVATRDVTL